MILLIVLALLALEVIEPLVATVLAERHLPLD